MADFIAGRLSVPCPAKIGKAAHPTSQRQQSVPEEDAPLNKMGKAVEDVVSMLLTVSLLR